ncbi:MAG: bacteriohemerythrin [Thermodesulfobacteriota bacterium]
MGISEFKPPRIDEPEPASDREAGAGPPPAGPAIRWDERLELGVEEIDDQHKALVGYCNDLVAAVRAGRGPQAVARIMGRLREYTVAHFAAEERHMQRIGYPELERRRAVHADMTGRVKDFQHRICQHDAPDPAEVRAFLKEWLIGHILGQDLKIAAFQKSRESAPPAAGPDPETPPEPPAEPPVEPPAD